MEEKCKKCSSKAEYICVCVEKHLCDKCLLNHVSGSAGLSHRPVSLAHPLLTLLMESEPSEAVHIQSNTISDQIQKLSKFKEKSMTMIDKKIKQLLKENEKNSLRKSITKTNDTTNVFKPSSGLNSRLSPVPDSRSQYNKSPALKIEDLSPDPVLKVRQSFIKNSEVRYKIIISGDSKVGKTTLMTTFKSLNNPSFVFSKDKSTGSIKIENSNYHIDLWDLSGKDRYFALNKLCLYKAAGAIILFDLTNEISLMTLENRLEEFSKEADVLSVVAMVGNKLDLTVRFPKKRFISYEKAYEFASAKGLIYEEISATNPQHVFELFKRITKEINRRKFNNR